MAEINSPSIVNALGLQVRTDVIEESVLKLAIMKYATRDGAEFTKVNQAHRDHHDHHDHSDCLCFIGGL